MKAQCNSHAYEQEEEELRLEQQFTPKERAELLKNKYSKKYLQSVFKGIIHQNDYWGKVANELKRLYETK